MEVLAGLELPKAVSEHLFPPPPSPAPVASGVPWLCTDGRLLPGSPCCSLPCVPVAGSEFPCFIRTQSQRMRAHTNDLILTRFPV